MVYITIFILSFILSFIYFIIIRKPFSSEMKKWEIGDEIYLNNKHPDKSYKLLGWNKTHIFLEWSGNTIQRVSLYDVTMNKSYNWRKFYEQCKKVMKKEPLFKKDFSYNTRVENNKANNGMPDVSLMTETECQVYLKIALDEENYELAEKIRQRLDNYFR